MQIRDRIKELRRVRACDLAPHPKNWRTHPKAQQDALRGVLAEVGYADALLARELPDGRLMLIDGHLRAETTPESLVPVLVLDVDEAEAAKILATLDPLAAMAEADTGKLDALLREVQTGSEALAGILTELAQANGVIPALPEPGAGGDDFDGTPDESGPTRCQRGDLWLIDGGKHRLLCGDSTKAEDVERVMGGEKAALCFTSPPYACQRKYDESSGFEVIPPEKYVGWWELVQAPVKSHLTADGSFFINIKPSAEGLDTELYVFDLVCAMVRQWDWHFATEFCWERSGVPKSVTQRFKNQFEPIYQFALGRWKMRPESVQHKSDSVPIPIGKGAGNTGWGNERQGIGGGAVLPNRTAAGMAYPGNRLPSFGTAEALGHTAAFPVGLPTFFISAYTDPGDCIYDPFLGSGTTIIAAHRLGRRCFGIEISPRYCDVVLKRCEAEGLTAEKATI